MRVDRRQFIHAGTVVLIAGGGCGGRTESPQPEPGTAPKMFNASNGLRMTFEGLYVIQQKTGSAVVHLVDAAAVEMPEHFPRMRTLASSIDQDQTARPDSKHVEPVLNDELWYWDLKDVNVTGPTAANGVNDLDFDQPLPNEDVLPIPSNEPGWHSPTRVPDMRQLCGSTGVIHQERIASSVTITHGHLGVRMPEGLGSRAVWSFTDPSGRELKRGAMSNMIEYFCPNGSQPLSIQAGSNRIVFKANSRPTVEVTNLPTDLPGPCPLPCTPNMNHFKALCKVVDQQFEPKVSLVAFTPKAGFDVGADYCPGGRV